MCLSLQTHILHTSTVAHTLPLPIACFHGDSSELFLSTRIRPSVLITIHMHIHMHMHIHTLQSDEFFSLTRLACTAMNMRCCPTCSRTYFYIVNHLQVLCVTAIIYTSICKSLNANWLLMLIILWVVQTYLYVMKGRVI